MLPFFLASLTQYVIIYFLLSYPLCFFIPSSKPARGHHSDLLLCYSPEKSSCSFRCSGRWESWAQVKRVGNWWRELIVWWQITCRSSSSTLQLMPWSLATNLRWAVFQVATKIIIFFFFFTLGKNGRTRDDQKGMERCGQIWKGMSRSLTAACMQKLIAIQFINGF